ncbi:MAG: hypothetical protein ABIN91_05715 [Mucilaginibacter sp.]|uniref:hypothetical protein n=1 Tax=Mucilaginibacter sp. TaxID=1882438 RepID=UPI0032647B10
MPKSQTTDLIKFLSAFNEDIQQLALWLRAYVWDKYPQCNELIYDNYNAVAFGWSPTEKLGDTFCSIAVYGNKDVHFGFYRGSQISDPEKLLLGKGSQYRYIKVISPSNFPEPYIKKLLAEAYANSMAKLKPDAKMIESQTIVKSISELKNDLVLLHLKK